MGVEVIKDSIVLKKISEIDINDVFFDSLKKDYIGFENWFSKKATAGEEAYIFKDNGIQGFLYLKEEVDSDDSIIPCFDCKRRLKVGTFKINAHGTKLGERFVKIIIDEMFKNAYEEAYVTIFNKHENLINLLGKYGFIYHGEKHSKSGVENVYMKNKNSLSNNIFKDYPIIDARNKNKFLLAIYPQYHTKMFPDSKLVTERNFQMRDISVTNSIEKIYLSGISKLCEYKKGDIVVIYRTADQGKIAKYSSVATTICVIDEIKNINSFKNYYEFENYCIKYSVFEKSELERFWRTKKYPFLIKFLYNIALDKRITRDKLINEVGLDENARWAILDINDSEFEGILNLGEVDNNFIIR